MLAIMFPALDPVALDLGFFQIRWYSLAYIVGAILGLFYIKYLVNKMQLVSLKNSKPFFDDMLFYCLVGILLGGRLGYVLFYGFSYYISNPLKILYLWEGGMSFHGGLIGGTVACYFLAKKYGLKFLQVGDIIIPAMPIGLFLGRIANFVNAELYGKETNVPWAMIFPNDPLPRHPSQLYEAVLEGVVLFIVLFIVTQKGGHKKQGLLTGLALLLYGFFRFFVEFVRQGEIYFFNIISMGQVLSLPLIVIGAIIIYYAYSNPQNDIGNYLENKDAKVKKNQKSKKQS